MPIAINPISAGELSPQLDDALEIVCNEFDSLDPHRQYHNSFSRVLKPDPLGRVLMMGTDQRDLFVPLLRRAVGKFVSPDGHIFDFGAGDGQTFAYVAEAVPAGDNRLDRGAQPYVSGGLSGFSGTPTASPRRGRPRLGHRRSPERGQHCRARWTAGN